MRTSTRKNLIQAANRNFGIFTAKDVELVGLSARELSRLRSTGEIICISRGVFQLADGSSPSAPDYAAIKIRVPDGVICLISALYHHELTTEIPRKIYIAVHRHANVPRIDYPPISVHRFSGKAFDAGIEEHKLDGFTVRVYSPEKTIADCFKFRNKIGMDIVLEALKIYKKRNRFKIDELLKYAKINRMEKIMTPYLEAML